MPGGAALAEWRGVGQEGRYRILSNMAFRARSRSGGFWINAALRIYCVV
jgi:hypothetical protein